MELMNPEAMLDEVMEQYDRFVNPGLAKLLKFAQTPMEHRAEGCIIWDAEGKPYLDCLGGYGMFSVGHRNPHVVEAVKRQLDLMPLPSKVFFNKPLADLSEKLAELTPGDLQYTFFVNSGTEAVEAALKFARKASGKTKFVSTIGGYHGKTMGALSATGREKYRQPFEPLIPSFSFVPYNDLDAMSAALDDDTAAVIIETIQGEGGIRIPSPDYLPQLAELCKQRNVLLIVDEVQTGFGRTGKMFGVDHYGIEPDIMTFAKSLGGGVMPVGAITATPAIWQAVLGENPTLHTSTFGGNPLGCAAGLAMLETLEKEDLIERSRVQGEKLLQALKQAQPLHPETLIDVRGKGLMIGVEFAQDEVGELVIASMIQKGVLAAYTLNNPRVIRFEPPLIISDEQIAQAAEVFQQSLTETVELLNSLS